MSLESIKKLLETVMYYNTVNIEQSFHKGDEIFIIVKCVKETRTLEVTYIGTQAIAYYEQIEEAADAIHKAISLPEHSQPS